MVQVCCHNRMGEKMTTAICIPCDRNYLEGLKVLLTSLYYHNNGVPEIIIISEDISYLNLTDFSCQAIFIHRPMKALYEDIPTPERFPTVVHYSYESLKLGYDRVIWIGADQLIVGDISFLWKEDLPPFCAVRENARDFSGNICTGFLTVQPDAFPNLWEEWMKLATQGESYDGGDQGVINKWVQLNKIDVHYFDEFLDVSKRIYKSKRGWWNKHKDKFRSIHYVGAVKPWMKDPEENLDKLWWSYYHHAPIEIPEG